MQKKKKNHYVATAVKIVAVGICLVVLLLFCCCFLGGGGGGRCCYFFQGRGGGCFFRGSGEKGVEGEGRDIIFMLLLLHKNDRDEYFRNWSKKTPILCEVMEQIVN